MRKIIEAVLSSEDRDKLKDNDFGLPSSRSYPLIDADHVRSAIAYFHHCDEKDRKELAANIKKAADKFGIVISKESEVSRYL